MRGWPEVARRSAATAELRRERGQERARVRHDRELRGLVEPEDLFVDVDLDHLLLVRLAPVRRLAPPIGLAEARADDQHDIGFAAGLVDRLHGPNRQQLLVIVGQGAAAGPARGDRRP